MMCLDSAGAFGRPANESPTEFPLSGRAFLLFWANPVGPGPCDLALSSTVSAPHGVDNQA